MVFLFGSTDIVWRSAPQKAVDLSKKAAPTVRAVRSASKDCPLDGFIDLWHNHEKCALHVNCEDWANGETRKKWASSLLSCAEDVVVTESRPQDDGEGLWVKISQRSPTARAVQEKRAVSTTLNALSKGLGYRPGVIPGAPSPVIAGLSSGLLGAGLGYGGGWLLERLMPEKWRKGRLSKTLGIMGGLAGMVPAGLWMANNAKRGLPWYSGQAMETPKYDLTGLDPGLQHSIEPSFPDPNHGKNWADKYFAPPNTGPGPIYPPPPAPPAVKGASTGYSGNWPTIDVAEFTDMMWDDPRVGGQLPPALRAAATGVVRGASELSGGSKWVTPGDMARMSAGMGAGYLSGALVGKVLGGLMGMPEETQQKLRNYGVMAGAVKQFIPMLF